MPFSCTSPTSITEEEWMNEVFAFSSFGATLQESEISPPASAPGSEKHREPEPELDNLFSGHNSEATSSTTPGAGSHTQGYEEEDHMFLDSVSCRLQKLKESNSLTPKALESLFNTQDVLADSGDWQTEQRHRQRRSRACTSHSPEHAPKSSCHLRQKAGEMHSQGLRKRKSVRGKTPKTVHHHGIHSLLTLPLGSRSSSATNVLTFGSPTFGPRMSTSVPHSTCETPLPEAWTNVLYNPSPEGPEILFAESDLGPSARLFDGVTDMAPYAEISPIDEAPRLAVSPILETSAIFPAMTGSMQMPLPGNPKSSALQEAIAYIDYLREENLLQKARLEGIL